MAETTPPYAAFLGTWILIPGSCEYEQGDPPKDGVYVIEERGDRLVFTIAWTDASGVRQRVSFDGVPDGVPEPFEGSDLADALAVELVSPRDLRTCAYLDGREHMVAQRQLDDTGMAMRVTQLVRFLDGTHLSNVSIYRRQVLS